jgi:tol-pal system protein YbgF
MKRTNYLSTCAVIALALSSVTAKQSFAFDEAQSMERVDKLERDIMLLQRQISRGESGTQGLSSDISSAGTPAQLEVRLSAIDDQLRELRGKAEENENRSRKVAEALEKLQKDTELRFSELSAANTAALPPEKAASTSGSGTLTPPADDNKKGAEEAAPAQTFATPREHYNYAFRLLNQTQYEESATSFQSFTKKYPKDPLVGNAYYWGGETHYIRRDYVKAADNFRKGFEALPEGPKAADNLLKLAMSLHAMNRDKESCVVLKQVVVKFKKSSSSVADKADQEQKRIGCNK